MKTDKKAFSILISLSILLGGGAGIITSTMTSRAIESYAAQLLKDQKLISLIPRKSPSLPGTFAEAMKVNREASMRSLAVILPVSAPSTQPAAWVFPTGDLRFGVSVTGDGWILTTAQAFGPKAVGQDWDVYVEGRSYKIDKVVRDSHSSLVLLKLQNANGLSTVSFGKPEAEVSGNTLVAWAGEEDIMPTILEAADQDVKFGPLGAEVFSTIWRAGDELPAGAPIFSVEAELLGFALGEAEVFPLHHAGGFVQDVLKTGTPKLSKLGASVLDLSRAYNVSESVTGGRSDGAVIISLPAGPALTAGLAVGDIILDIDGRAVTHAETLAEILADYEPGEIANIHLIRGQDSLQFAVTLGELE